MADFGADVPFARVVDKLKEHYGITVPVSAATTLTYRHAHGLTTADVQPLAPSRPTAVLITEADGSMIPVVQCGGVGTDTGTDKRRQRNVAWKEARLSLVRNPDEVAPVFAVTLGDTQACGRQLKELAISAGLTRATRVHALGDGAPWIADQIEQQFGAQGRYLIDFYHLCDYLAAAASVCASGTPTTWLDTQKIRLRCGELAAVMSELDRHLEPESDSGDTPVRDAYRYIANRAGQFDYPAAIANQLPIGSGEVESAHRYIIQKRLKLPGAWWNASNAQAMLNLRCLRANHRWNDYWDQQAA
jgi:hypothetical protein